MTLNVELRYVVAISRQRQLERFHREHDTQRNASPPRLLPEGVCLVAGFLRQSNYAPKNERGQKVVRSLARALIRSPPSCLRLRFIVKGSDNERRPLMG